jgi:HD superfamily phosphohydrolase
MRALVYDHKVARCTGAMISKAVQYAMGRDGVNKDTLSTRDLQGMKDADLMIELKKDKYRYSKDLIRMLEDRHLLKLAGIVMKKDIKDLKLVLEMSQHELWKYENDLAERLGAEPFEVIIDKPNINRYFVQEGKMPVYREEKRRGTLMECSELANQINAQHERLWAIRFYTPEKVLAEARSQFKKVTGIELQRPTKSPVKCKIWH